jgi:hypothetical protein
MPSTLDPGDRNLLLIAGGILLILIAVTVLLAPPPEEAEGTGSATTYSTGKNGAQAAYLLLKELGYRSERWEKSPLELPSDASGNILVFARPTDFPDKKERAALLDFVRAGGWIIYAGEVPYLFLEAGAVTPPSFARLPTTAGEQYSAASPSPLTAASPKITINAGERWVSSAGTQVPLYGDVEEPVVVTWRLGRGRILWWAAPTPVTNAGIAQEGNLSFFLGCVQAVRPGANPAEITVLWDEYFHGYRGSLWDYFAGTPVPWAAVQLTLLVVLALVAFARRNGPLFSTPADSRLSPLEFVDTLSDLYHRANAGSAAAGVAYHRFRAQLVRHLAVSPSISNLQLDAAVRERLGWKQPGLMDTLQRAEKVAVSRDVSNSDALKIVQALEHYEVLFGLKTRPNEEKL